MWNLKLAVHHKEATEFPGCFSKRWIAYCQDNSIPFKVVDCHASDVIADLAECDGLLWHFSHANRVDHQLAINLIMALESSGKKVFPNSAACWHFDDKVAQKYLLEAIQAPLIKSHVFWSKATALHWISTQTFPVVAKQRGGAASANVRLLVNSRQAEKYIDKAFGKGFRQFDRTNLFVRSLRRLRDNPSSFGAAARSFGKIFVQSEYERVRGRDLGYVYFQEFLPGNSFDIRIVVVGNHAFGIKRLALGSDFRASGSGRIIYDRRQLDEQCVEIAFVVTRQLHANCLAFDFLYDLSKKPLIAEVSYGFVQEPYDLCDGYWDDSMSWHPRAVTPQVWMIEDLIDSINSA